MTHHLVLVLLLLAAKSGACPSMCICTHHPQDPPSPTIYTTSVQCQTYTENMTDHLTSEVSELFVKNLDEYDVQLLLDELARVPNLAKLTITESALPDVLNFTLRLEALSLRDNKITNLSFDNLSNITSLDLSHNDLVTLTNEFRTLDQLETLNLSANCINQLESTFADLVNLKCLDLSLNNLTQINDTLFIGLNNLQFLNLSANQLSILDERCFSALIKLQQLDVSKNQLVQLELSNLQLPSLLRLYLTDNTQLGVSPIILGTGQKLQTLEASKIGLKEVPEALTRSIRTLRLSDNSIKVIRCGDLDSYPLLQLLDLKHNRLHLIEDDALGRLDLLHLVYLSFNWLIEVPKTLSEKVRVLHLEHNRIARVCNKDLQGLGQLEVLLLNDNAIEVIEEDAFAQLASLVNLDLSRNPITVLGCLSSSMRLQVLHLANLAVIRPPKEASFPLSSTEHLLTLDVAGSPGLARQLLADTAALAGARQLQELDLSFNQLTYMRSDLLHFLPQLRKVRLAGNRLNCTQLEWLGRWMRRQNEPEYGKIACGSPPELWGTLLIDLQELDTLSNEIAITEALVTQTAIESSTIEPNEMNANNFIPKKQKKNRTQLEIGKNKSLSTLQKGEMSKFRALEPSEGLLHPGMFILALGILGAAAALAILVTRCSRRKRRETSEEFEVRIPDVTELW